MSNPTDHGDALTFLVRFSNWRRRAVEKQNLKETNIFKKRSLFEIAAFNYFPAIAASSLLAPLNRVKVILQVQNMIVYPTNTKVVSNSSFQIFKSISNYLFVTRLNINSGIVELMERKLYLLRKNIFPADCQNFNI
jgi:hypothetical protein